MLTLGEVVGIDFLFEKLNTTKRKGLQKRFLPLQCNERQKKLTLGEDVGVDCSQ